MAAGLLASVGPAAAQVTRGSQWSADRATSPAKVDDGPAMANFEGHRIDLSANWEQAKACVVLRQADLVECFRSVAQMEARATTVTAQYAASGFSCSSPLRLYEHNTYGGRQLMFFDRLYWQNLPDYGFDNQMTSYIVGACYSYLADYVNGGGSYYPGPTTAWSAVPWPAAGWDNRVSSIYMA